MSKTILLTGATAGIGRTSALHLARACHHVLASGRRAPELATLAAEAKTEGLHVDTILLDVTSAASIATAVAEVASLAPTGLDVLVNNAGFGVLGPTSEISDAEIRRQYDTNVFGLMAVTSAFLPAMRERRRGRIINVSSLGGRITLPYFGVYNSTKYAVESLSDALRYELRAFGIDVVLIEPGVIRTNFEATAVASLRTLGDSPYAPAVAKYDELSRTADRFASNPIVVAKAIARAIDARRPAARYVAPRRTHAMLFAAAITPTRVLDWAMRRIAFLTPKTLGLATAPIRPDAGPPTSTTSTTSTTPTTPTAPAHATHASVHAAN